MLSKILIPTALFVATFLGLQSFVPQGVTFGAPTASIRVERSINPEADSTYWLGTSTKAWKDIYTDQLCLAGDCKTAWPSGSGGAFPFTPTTNYNAAANSTSTPIWFTAGLMGSTTANYFNGATIDALKTPLISSVSSAGTIIEAANGTDVGLFGAGNTSNTTLYGGVNIDGATRLATSLTGLLKASSGAVTTATAGTDYEAGLTAGDGLTRTVNDFDCDTASASVFGCLTAANWVTFNNKWDLASSTIPINKGGTGLTTLGASSTVLTTNGTIMIWQSIVSYIETTVSAASLVLTGAWDFGGANSMEIPNGSNPTVNAIGEVALDTTSNLLIVATSTAAGAAGTIPLFQYSTFTYSTSTAWAGTTTIPLGVATQAEVWLSVQCYTNIGTIVASFGNGSATSTSLQASTTIGTVTLAYAYTAGNRRYAALGTPATAPTSGSCTVKKMITRD